MHVVQIIEWTRRIGGRMIANLSNAPVGIEHDLLASRYGLLWLQRSHLETY